MTIRSVLASLAALAAAASPVAALPASGDCTARLCNVEALGPFLARLAQARPDGGRPVHILQIGDSHTAGDGISNGWRTLLQARHGFGGRGVLAPGKPYQGVLTYGVTQSMSTGWTVNAAFGPRWTPTGAPIGMTGFSLTTTLPGERLGVTTDSPDQNFDKVTVCGVRQPTGGTAVLQMGGNTEILDLKGDTPGAVCRSVEAGWRFSSADLTTRGDGIVTITSFSTFARRGGVVLSNMGIVGSQMVHLNRESDAVVADEMAEYRPDLIVLAFGTNEGFSMTLGPDQFESDLRAQIRRVRRLAPGVPIMLLGAPDANTTYAGVANNFGAAAPCPPFGTATAGTWYTPTLLGAVRERQRRVARELGLAFWDWNQAMGGTCAAMRWRGNEPPLMRPDHVHYTTAGANRIGALLFGDIEAALAGQPQQP